MTRNDYIQKLASELRGFEKSQQKEILQEIESLIAESNCADADLVKRFGTPAELAVSYGKAPAKPQESLMLRISKKLIYAIGIIIVLLTVTAAYLFWSFGSDKFDYSDENHPELVRGSSKWQYFALASSAPLHVEQSQVIFYWHDKDVVGWRCDNPDTADLGTSLAIKSNRCYILLPNKAVKINSTQAQIVLVGPNYDIDLDTYQTELKIAPKGKKFQLKVDKNQSYVDSFDKVDNPVTTINVKAEQSTVRYYDY